MGDVLLCFFPHNYRRKLLMFILEKCSQKCWTTSSKWLCFLCEYVLLTLITWNVPCCTCRKGWPRVQRSLCCRQPAVGSCPISSTFPSVSSFCSLQPHALLQRVKSCISDEEEEKLMQITSLHSLNAFLLPIKTVGVQVGQLIQRQNNILNAAFTSNVTHILSHLCLILRSWGQEMML